MKIDLYDLPPDNASFDYLVARTNAFLDAVKDGARWQQVNPDCSTGAGCGVFYQSVDPSAKGYAPASLCAASHCVLSRVEGAEDFGPVPVFFDPVQASDALTRPQASATAFDWGTSSQGVDFWGYYYGGTASPKDAAKARRALRHWLRLHPVAAPEPRAPEPMPSPPVVKPEAFESVRLRAEEAEKSLAGLRALLRSRTASTLALRKAEAGLDRWLAENGEAQ